MTEPHVIIADDLVALLKYCQMLQSEKEGVTRPVPETYSREDDPFADRISQAIGFTRYLLPMAQQIPRWAWNLNGRGKFSLASARTMPDRHWRML